MHFPIFVCYYEEVGPYHPKVSVPSIHPKTPVFITSKVLDMASLNKISTVHHMAGSKRKQGPVFTIVPASSCFWYWKQGWLGKLGWLLQLMASLVSASS
jgi:uncharacterized protein (DUF3820 family)